MQVEREVLGQAITIEDLIDQFTVARAEADGVVSQLVMMMIQAKIEHKQGVAHALVLQCLSLSHRRGMLTQQIMVGVNHVCVGGDGAGREYPAIFEMDSRNPVFLRFQPGHAGIQFHFATQILEQFHHALHQCARAAAREPDPPFTFQRMNQRVDGGGGKGIAAHQQRVKGERLTQVFILNVACHLAVNTAPGLQFCQLRRGTQHVAEREKRHGAQFQIAFGEHGAGVSQKTAIAFDITRIKGGDLRFQFGLIVVITEDPAGLPAETIKGPDRQQLNIVSELFTCQRK